jgi:hypothetical protein
MKDLGTSLEPTAGGESDLDALSLEREPSINRLISDFLSFYKSDKGIELICIEDMPLSLTYSYFLMLYTHIKPSIEANSSRYKMASILELVIVKEQMLSVPNSEDRVLKREINAKFGIYAALSLINCMKDANTLGILVDSKNAGVDEKIEQLIYDHETWLKTKPLNDVPIIINGQFYEVLESYHNGPYLIHG